MSWYDNIELSSRVDAIGWNYLQKKKKKNTMLRFWKYVVMLIFFSKSCNNWYN